MLGQHRADAIGFRKAGMGPQHGCARPLPENALYRIGIGMRVQEDFVFFRELHDLAEYLAIGILAEDMKFADPGISALFQATFQLKLMLSRYTARNVCRMA